MSNSFDLLVIGAGPAGVMAAKTAGLSCLTGSWWSEKGIYQGKVSVCHHAGAGE